MINNLIFDMGGVLISYRWKEAFADFGLEEEEFMRIGQEIFEFPMWHELDLGNVSVEETRVALCEAYPEDKEAIDYLLINHHLMHCYRPKVYELVQRLKDKGYKIYILSNYCKELYDSHTVEIPFLKDVDGSVISYQIHKGKPDREIYEHLLNKYSLAPEECIFFDDRKENVKGAEDVGITGFLVDHEDEQSLIEKLEEFFDAR